MPHRRHSKHQHPAAATVAAKGRAHPQTPRPFLDYVVYFFSIATPLFELPQAYTIYINQSAADVSITTWSFFLLDNIVWIIYAAKRRVLPLLLSTILYLVIELSIVIGILLYA